MNVAPRVTMLARYTVIMSPSCTCLGDRGKANAQR